MISTTTDVKKSVTETSVTETDVNKNVYQEKHNTTKTRVGKTYEQQTKIDIEGALAFYAHYTGRR